jgi:hypothetical protein
LTSENRYEPGDLHDHRGGRRSRHGPKSRPIPLASAAGWIGGLADSLAPLPPADDRERAVVADP